MKRLVLALGACVALHFACTFDTPPFGEHGYLPCHEDGSCDHPDCACLDGKVCVPRKGLSKTLDPQKCQCPSGGKVCAGECVDLTSDPRHCGSCETDCIAQFTGSIGEPVCLTSQCAVVCPTNSSECDGDWKNGCDPLGTFQHCADCRSCSENQVCNGDQCASGCDNGESPCGRACCSQQVKTPTPQGAVACINDNCAMICDPGWGDCGGGVADGCETFLDNIRACKPSCLGGDVDCLATMRNVEAVTCENGACGYTQCKIDFGDCDNDPSNGCETSLVLATSCGSDCGNLRDCTQEVLNAEGTYCDGNSRQCNYVKCKPWASECDGIRENGCDDILHKPEHCGACGRVCTAPNTRSDALECANGICVIPDGACEGDFRDCDGLYFNGCETMVKGENIFHCGACGVACPIPTNTFVSCVEGTCRSDCLPGWFNCDTTSMNCETGGGTMWNCLHCNNECTSGESCTADGCTDETCSQFRCQDGSCPDFATDVTHCGNCTTSCYDNAPDNSVPRCVGGRCDYTQCRWPYVTCGNPTGAGSSNCETNLLTDPAHCGDCSTACAPGQVCTNGVCGEPGVICEQSDNCTGGSVCCAIAGGSRTCTGEIRQCQTNGLIVTCDGSEDCAPFERCWLFSQSTVSVSVCRDSQPSNGIPLCSLNRDCPSDPFNPTACCGHPTYPEINTCQPGCKVCGNTCLVGDCNLSFETCGDNGIGVCPMPCNASGPGSICCWDTNLGGAVPTCTDLESCGFQAGMVQLDCNDNLDCLHAFPGIDSVCCLASRSGHLVADCMTSLQECKMFDGMVVCASDADCFDPDNGTQKACLPYTNAAIIYTCQ